MSERKSGSSQPGNRVSNTVLTSVVRAKQAHRVIGASYLRLTHSHLIVRVAWGSEIANFIPRAGTENRGTVTRGATWHSAMMIAMQVQWPDRLSPGVCRVMDTRVQTADRSQ